MQHRPHYEVFFSSTAFSFRRDKNILQRIVIDKIQDVHVVSGTGFFEGLTKPGAVSCTIHWRSRWQTATKAIETFVIIIRDIKLRRNRESCGSFTQFWQQHLIIMCSKYLVRRSQFFFVHESQRFFESENMQSCNAVFWHTEWYAYVSSQMFILHSHCCQLHN